MKYLVLTALLIQCLKSDCQPVKLSRDLALKDIQLLKTSLEEGHPVLYNHTSKRQLDAAFMSLQAGLKDSIDITEFYLSLSKTVAFIRDGHTRMILAGGYRDSIFNQTRTFLPFSLRFLSNRIFIYQSYSEDTGITDGAEMLSINNIRSKELVGKLMSYVTADEGNKGFLLRRLNLEARELIPLFFELPASYQLLIKNPGNPSEKKITVSGLSLARLTEIAKIKYPLSQAILPKWEYAVSQEGNKLKSILTIRDFLSRPDSNYFNFIDSAFTDLKKRDIKNLVIDLRQNTGGYDEHAIATLFKLVSGPFKYYKETFIRQTHYNFLKYTNAQQYNAMVPNLNPQLRKDSLYEIELPWEKKYKGKTATGYAGKIFILINERTFSSANIIAVGAFNYANATLIGEPTGGAYSGSSGATVLLTLPNSKFLVQVPLVYSAYSTNKKNPGKGLQPTHSVHPSIMDIVNKKDPVMEFTLKLIDK